MKLINPHLMKQAKSSRLAIVLTIALGFLAGMFTVIQARTLSQVINGVFLDDSTLQKSAPLLGLLLIIFLGRAITLWAGEISAKRVALRVKTSLRKKLYAHIQNLGPLYSRAERTGELVNTATEGIEALDAYFSEYLPQLALAALVPITFLFFVFPLDRLSGLVLLLTAPLIPIFMVLIGDRADAITKRQWRTLSRMSAHFLDILQGLTTLKLFGRSRAQIGVIRLVSERFRERTMHVLQVAFLSALVLELVATLSTAVVAVEIGLRLLYGRLAFEQALFVLLLAPEFFLPLRLLGTRFHAGVAGVTAATRIFDVLEIPCRPKIKAGELINSTPRLRSAIIFESVSYSYSDGREALRKVSFTVEPGQKVALVGPSGSGKSTIAALLLGWMNSSEGRLLRSVGPGEIAWLPQNPYLFHDTITANIRIACPTANLEQVIVAAKNAQAHEFIAALSDGYDTLIGERGSLLSAGQAQRIALARAFLMDASFVILDEPTASLDPELEVQIQESLDQLLQNRTALIIAHRLNTLRHVDKIIVLDQGQVVQQGSFDELSAQNGLFLQLINATGKQAAANNHKPPSAVHFQPSAPTTPSRSRPASSSSHPIPRLLAFLRPNLGWIGISILLGFLTIASGIGLMGASAYIISAAALQPSIAMLQVPIVGVRFFGISRGLFRYLERLVSHHTTFRVLAQLRVWFYEQLEPLAPARLQQYRSGELLSNIVSDINSLENFYIRVIAPPLIALLVALFSGILLMNFAPQLTLILWLFLTLAGILLPWWTFRLARGLGAEILVSRSALSGVLVDGIQGLPDLLAFGRGADQLTYICYLGKKLAQTQARYSRLHGLQAALMNLLTNLGMWLVLVISIPLVGDGQIDGIYLAVIALVALTSFEAVQPLPQAAQYLEENLRAAERLFEIIDTEPEVIPPVKPLPIKDDSTISITNLKFQYPIFSANSSTPDSTFCIHPATFCIPQGKRLAIVGPSGAGKTTLLYLLLRFWEFQEGDIKFGGQDIRNLALEDLRRQFAVVSQHTHLFNASLRDNLLIAKPDATEAEIRRAAKNAHIDDFIKTLPEGYETFIGEQGMRLSGGERQRVAISRALLKNAPILILDEPTANLDTIAEQEVLKSIYALMEGRSTLSVTHRLVGMDWMDEILVLQDGKIVERGNHAELLAQAGLYCRMWELQQQGFM